MLTGEARIAAAVGSGQGQGPARVRREARAPIWVKAFAYSNGAEDVPMLEVGGASCGAEPRPQTGGDRAAERVAVGESAKSGERRDPMSTSAPPPRSGALMARPPSVSSAGMLTGTGRRARTWSARFGPDLALAICWASTCGSRARTTRGGHGPAVFMFNHQSSLDMLVIGSVIQRDVDRGREEGGGARSAVHARGGAARRRVHRPDGQHEGEGCAADRQSTSCSPASR